MRKLDAHAHILIKNNLEGVLESFKKYLKNNDIYKLALMCCPTYESGDILENIKALYYKKELSPSAYAFAGLYYENFNNLSDKEVYYNNFYNQVKSYIENGYDGIKMLEGKPSERKKTKVMLSDMVYDKTFAYLEEKGVVIMLHNSDPIAYWDKNSMTKRQLENGWYVGDDMPSKSELFKDVITVLKRHPKLKLILAHFGFTTDAIWEAKEFLSYENTMFDVTPGWEQYVNISNDCDKWREFILSNDNRFILGTDVENFDYGVNLEACDFANTKIKTIEEFFSTDNELSRPNGLKFKGINLPKRVCKQIFYDNATRLFGDVKPINYDYVINEISRLSALIKTDYDKYALGVIKKSFNYDL